MGKTRTRWPGPTYSRVVSGASGRVLVVDDNKVIRQLIRVNLELEGLEVVTASDGAECLEVVHQVRPDLVTLDVVMPRLDGLRTAARLRADPRTHGLPLAIISACTQYEVEAGLEAGVDAFLSKPFDPADLVSLVLRLIEGKRGEGSGGDAPGGPAGADGGPGLGTSLGTAPGPAFGTASEACRSTGPGLVHGYGYGSGPAPVLSHDLAPSGEGEGEDEGEDEGDSEGGGVSTRDGHLQGQRRGQGYGQGQRQERGQGHLGVSPPGRSPLHGFDSTSTPGSAPALTPTPLVEPVAE